ncbi:MAG: nuclear transport factor 2 family protein [Verrucomicrobiota bacterium]|jgi:ketosteroid isomerase-like protein
MKRILILITAVCMAFSLSYGQTNTQTNAGQGKPRKAEQALMELEQEWAGAVKHRDVGKIDRIQAEEYVFTDPAGQTWTKTRALDTIKAGDLVIDSFELSDVQVKIYGNTAVVTFEITWNGRFRDTDISGPQRMTDVFVKRAGRWQCVASQATRIRSP